MWAVSPQKQVVDKCAAEQAAYDADPDGRPSVDLINCRCRAELVVLNTHRDWLARDPSDTYEYRAVAEAREALSKCAAGTIRSK